MRDGEGGKTDRAAGQAVARQVQLGDVLVLGQGHRQVTHAHVPDAIVAQHQRLQGGAVDQDLALEVGSEEVRERNGGQGASERRGKGGGEKREMYNERKNRGDEKRDDERERE